MTEPKGTELHILTSKTRYGVEQQDENGALYCDERGDTLKFWRLGGIDTAEFLERFKEPKRRNITRSQFDSLAKAKQDDVKDTGSYVLGNFQPYDGSKWADGKFTVRNETYLINRTGIAIDYDDITPDQALQLDERSKELNCAGVIHSTLKSTAENPRRRLVIPVGNPIPKNDFPSVVKNIAGRIGLPIDEASVKNNQFMYFPAVLADQEYHYVKLDGPLLDYREYRDAPKTAVQVQIQPQPVNPSPRGEAIPWNGYISDSRFVLPAEIPESKRDTTLTSYAGQLQAGWLPDETIREMLHQANEERCKPPLDAKQVDKICKSILKKPKATSAEGKAAKAREAAGIPSENDQAEAQAAALAYIEDLLNRDALQLDDLQSDATLSVLASIRSEPDRIRAATRMAKAIPRTKGELDKLYTPILRDAKTRFKEEDKKLSAEIKKAAQAQAASIVSNFTYTFKDGSIITQFTGDYDVDYDMGITRTIYKENGESRTFKACTHPALILSKVEDVENAINDTPIQLYKVAFFEKKLQGVREIRTTDSRELFSSKSQIVTLSRRGVGVTSETASELVSYFSELESLNRDTIPTEYGISRLGWFKDPRDGSLKFAPYDSEFVFDGNFSDIPKFNGVRTHGDRGEWLNVIQKIRGKSVQAKILFSATLASAALFPLHEQSFFVHARGDTELGKSFTLAVAASFWGDPFNSELVHTFDSTRVGRERTACFMHSLPLFLDEAETAAKRGRSNFFSEYVYAYCEGLSRTRGEKEGGTEKKQHWKNIAITTGEQPLVTPDSDKGGSINRVIDVRFNEALYDDPNAVKDIIEESYGFGGAEFVELLRDPKKLETLRGYARKYSKEYIAEGITGKQARAGALLVACDRLASKFIYGDPDSALTYDELKPYLRTKAELDIGERAYRFIKDWITTNGNHFDFIGEQRAELDPWIENEQDTTLRNTTTYGRIKRNEYAQIIPTVLYAALEEEGINHQTALEALKKKGYITPDKRGKNTVATRMNGNALRVVLFNLASSSDDNDLQ